MLSADTNILKHCNNSAVKHDPIEKKRKPITNSEKKNSEITQKWKEKKKATVVRIVACYISFQDYECMEDLSVSYKVEPILCSNKVQIILNAMTCFENAFPIAVLNTEHDSSCDMKLEL